MEFNYEKYLIAAISFNLKKLRENTYQKIPPELIANGQKSAILRIEKGENTASGNFISDTLLDSYHHYFNISKIELIFGTEKEQENELRFLFINLLASVAPTFVLEKYGLKELDNQIDAKVHQAVLQLAYSFADFGRWHDLRRKEKEYTIDDSIPMDFRSMAIILWKICKSKFIRSFREKVIEQSFQESDGKFHFNRINGKVLTWLKIDFSDIIVPEILEKLKNNSIFKMGFMVKNLIDEFLVRDLPPSYLEEIPLEEFFPPVKAFYFHFEDQDKTDENFDQLAEELFRFFSQKTEGLTINDLKKMDQEHYFEGVAGVTDTSTRFVNGTRIVSAEAFIDFVLSTPSFFDGLHELDRRDRKIPGILTVNSHASNLFQIKMNQVIEEMIDNLVRYQNIFINCIKWEELATFAK